MSALKYCEICDVLSYCKDYACESCNTDEAHFQATQMFTRRKCRQCSNRLPISRYFICEDCKPDLDEIEGEDDDETESEAS